MTGSPGSGDNAAGNARLRSGGGADRQSDPVSRTVEAGWALPGSGLCSSSGADSGLAACCWAA
jgi:hypothetical protein